MAGRSDLVRDPSIRAGLLLARRGQAFYARALGDLSDADLDGPTLLPDWDRRHLVAHVGLNARALTRLVEWADTGVETPMYASPTARIEEIDFAATLPAYALRNLSDHAAIHLSVAWRDLPDAAWSHEVRTAQGRTVPVSETVWMRTREVWIHALDLDAGARPRDLPASLVDALLADVERSWARRRDAEGLPLYRFDPRDRPRTADEESADDVVAVHGEAAQILMWAIGRGEEGVVTADGRPAAPAPRWL